MLLRGDGIHKTFARQRRLFRSDNESAPALTNVSFSLRENETLAVVGESGAGKSTLGRVVAQLIEPDAGQVMLDDRDISRLRGQEQLTFRKSVQMIFQDAHSSLDPRRTIGDSISEPMLIHFGASRAERRTAVRDLLGRVGLDAGMADTLPRQLSGGQLQRVAIARALSMDPRVIVCDEPVSALDVSVQAQVLNLLKDLQAERGMSYLFITHDLSVVEAFASRVMVMRSGQVIESGSVDEIFDSPTHDYTKSLLASIPNPVPKSLR